MLSAAERKGNRWDDEAFWATGIADVSGALAECAPHGLKFGHALDFGCGVGRLSRALSLHFEQVDGVDVSAGMVELARQSPFSNTTFHENPYPHLKLFGDARFDFALSVMTLQHLPPGLMKPYVAELGRVLKPGALAWLQVPHAPRSRLSALRARTMARRLVFKVPGAQRLWKWRKGELPLEMYGLRREQMEHLLRRSGFEVLRVAVDHAAGDDWHSFHYVARRR